MTDLIKYTKSDELNKVFPEFSEMTVYGSVEEPLFPGSQVKDLVGITRIHYEDLDLGDDYIKTKIQTGGQMREVHMLTEQGLYTLVSRSRTDLGQKFRRFVKVVLKELRLRGQVTLTDALGKLQQELDKKQQFIAVLDTECERMREAELLRERELAELRGELGQARTQSGRLRKACRELLDEDIREERTQVQTERDSLLWARAKTKCLAQFHFVLVDDGEPAEDDDAVWKISTRAPAEGTYFTVHVWSGMTMRTVCDWLIQHDHGVKTRAGWSKSSYTGSQQSITELVTDLLLKD